MSGTRSVLSVSQLPAATPTTARKMKQNARAGTVTRWVMVTATCGMSCCW